jgi:3alpha(or 20beta)-hydroxysteroid dehydrogenase
MTSRRLEGKVAIVTGGTKGIGRATVERFLNEGANVIMTARDSTFGHSVCLELVEKLAGSQDSSRVIFVAQDVADESGWRTAIDTACSEYGRLDILVNNAAASVSQTIAESSVDDFFEVIKSNLVSVFIGMKYGAEAMLRTGGGAIINLSSVAAGKGHAVLPAYTAAKMGAEGLMACAVKEYAEAGQAIRINTVRPGYIETDLSVDFLKSIGGSVEAGLAIMVSQHPIGHVGKPDDVAGIITYLASDEARFVTGGVFSIDGGFQV